jgi:hypothetical protein
VGEICNTAIVLVVVAGDWMKSGLRQAERVIGKDIRSI